MSIADSLPMVRRADWVAGPPQGCWTYDDYAGLPVDGDRNEVLEGVLYAMPGPSPLHQGASARFTTHLTINVEFAGLGRVFAAPLDVLFPGAQPVQPDIIVLLNHKLRLISGRGIEGPPDLVVEIASPGTRTHDRGRKLSAYARWCSGILAG
jgi:Uma2 family endonuclease